MIIATAFSNESSLPFTYLFASHNLSFSMGSERAPQPFPHPAHRGCDDSRAQLAEVASSPELLRAACERLGPLPRRPALAT